MLDISGGTTTLAGLLSLGRAGFSGAGTVNMDGGTLSVGDIAMINGLFHFDGGDLFLSGDKTGIIDQAWFDGADGVTAEFDGTKTHVYIVPEPSVGVLLLGLAGLFSIRRRRP